MQAIAGVRSVRLDTRRRPTRRRPTSAIPSIVAGLDAAVAAVGAEPRLLPSGAGHDTMVMGQRWPAGMLFVRCKGGVSHNPAGVDQRGRLRHRARRADALRRGLPAGLIDAVRFLSIFVKRVEPGMTPRG